MPFGSVKLVPGVNVERTPTLLETGVSQSRLIRFRDSLVQKYGGWERYYPTAIGGVPRELHPWQDLSLRNHLLIGTTTELDVLTEGLLKDITPQTLTSDFSPNFSTTNGSPNVTVTDPNVSDVTIYDSVLFNTPVSIGGIVLSGLYQVDAALGGSSYRIVAATNATATTSGGAVPLFTTTNTSFSVKVTLNNHGIADSNIGTSAVFPIPTTGGGVTIQGNYQVITIIDANNFDINADTVATSSTSFSMNGGNAELVYYIAIGPSTLGGGYGTGPYGSGGYGTGSSTGQQTGTPITTTDWTSANWGEIALACPAGGAVYQYDPTAGFANARMVETAPGPVNGGIFVSTSLQILVVWGATNGYALGIAQDPLRVQWSNSGDFTDFTPLTTNQAGSFRIPSGSKIMGGMSTPYQNLLWTDLDCWAMNYQGPPLVFGFNKIGAGAALISSHAAQQLRGQVFWMGPSNFFATSGAGVQVIPCPVWDFVFQNLNEDFVQNIRAMPNTNFNEAGWLFPSADSVDGECDSYVKLNILEPNAPWDFGPAGALPRSAWTDQSILGPPIGAHPNSIIFQHERTNDIDGVAMNSSFTTSYFFLAEGEDFVFVDQILPDMRWGLYGNGQNAQVQLTFNVINFPGDTPRTFGPFTVTQSTEILSVRMRGRQMSITLASDDVDSFWRLGRIRYRWAPSGRR